jgi:hypothetical protein
MHTIARLHSFDRAANDAGLSEKEIDAIVNFLAKNPDAGDEMAGTGGCRKFRWPGKGKSGGFRTITFYSGELMPVFLITVFGKGQKSNLTAKECRKLKALTKQIAQEYRGKVATLKRGKTA